VAAFKYAVSHGVCGDDTIILVPVAEYIEIILKLVGEIESSNILQPNMLHEHDRPSEGPLWVV
jgi:hypothetical protein